MFPSYNDAGRASASGCDGFLSSSTKKTFGLKYFWAKTFIFGGSGVELMVGITTSPQSGFAPAPEFKK